MAQVFERSYLLSNTATLFQTNDHHALLQEFEALKNSENGWKECARILMTNPIQNDQTTFLCLQIIEHFIKKKYKTADSNDQAYIREFMSNWLQFHMNEKAFILRKSAQLFALVAVIDFPHRWKTFFHDIINTNKWSDTNADFYLKVLIAIDTEVVDREIPHTVEEANIATYFKDAIREVCVNDLVESWYMLLKEYSQRNPQITCETLEVIGAYISWIDINLIVNTKFVEYFNYSFSQFDLREASCSCLEEIINKGMEPLAKLKLIDFLWTNIINNYANNISQEKECDYLLKFGKMLNAIGCNLSENWHKIYKKEPNTAALLLEAIENKMSYVICLLSHSEDDISESVSDYCQNYIVLLKHSKTHNDTQKHNIEAILKTIINKTKFDSSYNFETEGEDEAMFLEYRKDIKVVFDSITQLDNDFVLNTVKSLVLDVTRNWQNKEFNEIENALFLLHSIGEAIPSSQGNYFATRNPKSEMLSEMLQAIVVSNLVYNEHRIVKLQYFENIVRYDKFFINFENLLDTAIDHFIGPNGLHHADVKVRSRVTYLFSRFIKDLKHLINSYVEKILNTIQDLLIIWTPTLTMNEINVKLNTSEDQLFLYETISVLIVTSNLQPTVKSQLMHSLLQPIVSSFPLLLQQYCTKIDENEKLVFAKCLNNTMLVASRASKGFSNTITLKHCNCFNIFLDVLRTFLPALNVTTHKNLINAGVRQYLHRMVVCLDNEILEYIPIAVDYLLKNNDAKDINEYLPLLNQIICKFKQQILGFMQQIFMQIHNNIMNVIFNTQQQTIDATSDKEIILEIQLLQKSYYQFLLALINNDLMNVIAFQETNNIYLIINTVIQGANSCNNETQKICFQVLGKFISYFVESKAITDFVKFTMENILPCCISIFFKPDTDINDAQQILVLNEIVKCLNLLYVKFGDDFIQYLEQRYLNTLQLSPRVVESIIQLAKTNNNKNYKIIREMMSLK